jgi:hypothetical protein
VIKICGKSPKAMFFFTQKDYYVGKDCLKINQFLNGNL